jgi:gluconate 5-dehydrogenase
VSSLFDLSNRVVLITGSSRGLGLAFAEGFCAAGACVVVNGTRPETVDPTVNRLKQAGGQAVGYPFDVTDPESVGDAIKRIEDEVGPIDVLINNAGIQRRAPLSDLTIAEWDAVLRTNLTSAFIVGRAVADGMIARERGCIINITSLNVEGARPTIANYVASKGGLDALTRSMAAEWGPMGVRTNAIAPGYFITDLTRPLADDPEFDSWVKANVPLRRWGDPRELIGAAIFLASDAASYVNGRTIHVDGGWRASL